MTDRKRDADLGIYVCPTCKGPSRKEERVLRCDTCSESYPIKEDIPDFLREELHSEMAGAWGQVCSAGPALRPCGSSISPHRAGLHYIFTEE